METSMTLVDTILVALIFLPLVLLGRWGNKSKRKLQREFRAIAKKYGLNIVEMEVWANANIGWDSDKNNLLFVRSEKDCLTKELIDMNLVADCQVHTSTKTIRKQKPGQDSLLQVDLQISFSGNRQPMKLLNFYDHNRMYSEDFEILRAKKWSKLIKEQASKAGAAVLAS